jgi:hypothetical protein
MFELGQPLGWDNSFERNIEKQLHFIKELNILTDTTITFFEFINVFENLVLFSVVNSEIQKYLGTVENTEEVKVNKYSKKIELTVRKSLREAERRKSDYS